MKQSVTSAAPSIASEPSARDLSDRALDAAVLEIRKEIDRLQGREAQLLGEWDARKIWSDDNSRSAGCRLARDTGISVIAGKRLINRARKLRHMPLTSAAFVSGSLSADRVDLLVRANQPRVASLFARDEEMLVGLASQMRFTKAVTAIEYWRSHADEVGTKDKHKRQLEQRTAFASKTFDGTVDVKALLDPISGDIFKNELDRLEKIFFEQDWAEAKAEFGEDVTVDKLKRTSAQRRADALVEMAKRSAAMPPGSRMPAPLFTVVLGRPGFEHLCELADGTVLTPDQLMPHLSHAQIERIIFDGPSRILDLGEQRNFVGALRRAIKIRDDVCQDPSVCDVPASKCQIDHNLAYIKGGRTDQYNGKCLCDFHNRKKGCGPP